MKKIIGALVGLAVIALLVVFGLRIIDRPVDSPDATSKTPDISSLVGPGPNDEALYDVIVKTKQRSGEREGTVISLTGVLAQVKQGDSDFVSEWREIKEFKLMDQNVDPSMTAAILKKPSVTTIIGGEIQHYLPKDFPAGLMTFQLSFLNRFFVPVISNSNNPVFRTERDEAGTAKIQYDFIEEGNNLKVLKTWDRYVQDAIKIDAAENLLTYVLSSGHRVIQVNGVLTTHYREPASIHFTTSINITFKNSTPKATLQASKEALDRIDLQRAAALAQEMARPKDEMSYEEAVKKVDAITEKSDGKETYEAFTVIRADVVANPQNAKVLIDKIMRTKARDEGSQRKLAILFGALAQSQAPEISDSLAKLADDCPDNFCKVQAIIGLSDHPNPTDQSAAKMLEIAQQSKDNEIASTALLAAGSVAKKLEEENPDLPRELIKELADPARAEIKNTVIAAMGNHGNAEYFTSLSTSLKDKDEGTRASAAYSLRYLPNAEVNGTLIGLLTSDPSLEVQKEALKAMAYRNLSDEEYLAVAQKVVTATDRDIQQNAARVLLSAHRDNPKLTQAAIDTMLKGSKFPEIKTWIEGELKPSSPSEGPGLQ